MVQKCQITEPLYLTYERTLRIELQTGQGGNSADHTKMLLKFRTCPYTLISHWIPVIHALG